jgi:hypothetical protein
MESEKEILTILLITTEFYDLAKLIEPKGTCINKKQFQKQLRTLLRQQIQTHLLKL